MVVRDLSAVRTGRPGDRPAAARFEPRLYALPALLLAGGTAYRLGGDEFCLLVPRDRERARRAAARPPRPRRGGASCARTRGEIPLGARIIAACDAYDAMRSERPYQRARSHAAAMAEPRRCAGTQFDPAVVTALEAELSPGFVADVATTASGQAAPPSPPRRPVRGRPAP
jgi:hypothetical protein